MTLCIRMLKRLALCLVSSMALGAVEVDFARDVRPLLAEHCFDCHGLPKGKGGITIEAYASRADVAKALPAWSGIVTVLRDQAMPPPASSDLTPADRAKLVAAIDGMLEGIYAGLPPDPGRVLLHRLSRGEYDRTMRDLLGIERSLSEGFPADGGGGEGFSNTADTLFIPPLLLEKLLDAAEIAISTAKPEFLGIITPTAETAKARKDAAKATALAFGARAWRRPLLSAEADRYVRVWETCIKKGISDSIAMRQMLKAMLAAPSFIFRLEATPTQALKPYPIGQYEMASRLSYFLWSSMPDETLFALAAAEKLQDPAVITAQVVRMLADPKASALGEEFAIQWLELEGLRNGGGPDPASYPEYTATLRTAMLGEPVAFMNGLVAHNRSILDLLDANYTYVNAELASHYGLGGGGAVFSEVRLDDPRRGGVLGMAAVLAVTSHPGRTSPVLRGRWVLDRLLASPPPPPPPNTPQLDKRESPKDGLSLRAKLEAHRTKTECASCHALIDPLGFPLENFDPLGRWRDRDVRGEPIDSRSVTADGTAIAGPSELRSLLLVRRERFARAFATKMLGYALGRGIGPHDRTTVNELVAVLNANELRVVPLITAIACSYPFRNASLRTPAPATTPSRPEAP